MEIKYSKAQISNAITHWTKVLESMEAAEKPAEEVDEGLFGKNYWENDGAKKLEVAVDRFKDPDPDEIPLGVFLTTGSKTNKHKVVDVGIEPLKLEGGKTVGNTLLLSVEEKPGKFAGGLKLSAVGDAVDKWNKDNGKTGDEQLTLGEILKKNGVMLAMRVAKASTTKFVKAKLLDIAVLSDFIVFKFELPEEEVEKDPSVAGTKKNKLGWLRK